MRVLGIESSCDETGVAIFDDQKGLVANTLFSQIDIHKQFGGVVPELASRDHVKYLIPLVDEALRQAKISKSDIDAIAYTAGPGLIGALLAGSTFAKSLALGLNIPALAVHHLEAHILAAKMANESLEFPFLSLLVSGGHTQLIMAHELGHYELLGDTLDDAVGEAFDKSAKILGLPYPGGPLIDKYAQHGDPTAFSFPKPKVGDLEFSFSGLKTAVLYFVERETAKDPHFIEENLHNICASLQFTIVDYLMDKLKNAVVKTGINRIAIGGGVSANSGIRKALKNAEKELGWTTYIPKFEYCTDNAAMIAIVGELKYLNGDFSKQNVVATARMKLS